jgi:hypothetical protein
MLGTDNNTLRSKLFYPMETLQALMAIATKIIGKRLSHNIRLMLEYQQAWQMPEPQSFNCRP